MQRGTLTQIRPKYLQQQEDTSLSWHLTTGKNMNKLFLWHNTDVRLIWLLIEIPLFFINVFSLLWPNMSQLLMLDFIVFYYKIIIL